MNYKNLIRLLDDIEPLLEVQLKQSNHHGMDSVSMSTSRAIEIIRRIKEIRKEIKLKEVNNKSLFHSLDQKFSKFI